MATLTLRSTKGSPLTHDEVDDNFTNLNTDKVELGDLSVTTNAAGTAALTYNSSTGVFSYTPPDLSAAGGGIELTDLSVTQNAAGTAALSYNNTTGVFSYTPPDLSSYLTSVALDDVSDVTITSPSSGQVLKYNGTAWVNAAESGGGGSGTVTSVAMTVPAGLTITGSPITTSGTLAVSYDTGYAIPTTAKQTQWDTAYSWGDHSTAGYLTTIAINGISDVTISTPADNEVLAYDSTSSEFINQTASEAGLATSAQGSLADSALQPADLSVTTNAAGTAALTYTSGTGVFSYTPPDLSGYLTSYTETDPVVGAITGIVKADGAGNISAAVAGTDYLASYTETDTLDSVTGRGATTTNAVTVGSLTSTGIDDNATSTAITIDASENVGINTNAPNVPLEVASQTPDTVSPFIRISSDTTADGYAYSAIAHGRVAGNLLFAADAGNNLADSYMQFTVDGTDRMKIDAAGTVKFYNAIEEAQYSLTGTAIDPSNGTIQYKTTTSPTTLTESLSDGEFVTLMITASGASSITWPTITWVGGSAPVLSTSGYNVVELWHVNGTLYGAFIGAA